MPESETIRNFLGKNGYSHKAIEYYINRVNFGSIENPTTHAACSSPCGDKMEIFLIIDTIKKRIEDAKFLAVGCEGAHITGSAITEAIKGKTLEEAKKMDENDLANQLDGIPKAKVDCAHFAKITLMKAIQKYKGC